MLLPDGSTADIVEDPSGVQHVIIRPLTYPPTEATAAAAPFPVYVPHTARHPDTAKAAPANATWVDVAQSPNAYYAALLSWWSKGETFMVLEHDVVCRPEIIDEFDECPEPWCLYPYAPECACGNPDCREAWRNALGCTRFRAELMATVPHAMVSIPPEGWDWHNVCDGLGNNLRAAGFTHHWHEPGVYHHRQVALDALAK